MTVVTVTVKIEGQAAPQDWGLMSVDVRRELNRLPSARLVYIDGDVADGSFPISDTGRFKPGAAVEIVARYEGAEGPGAQDKVLFKGLVVRHGLEAGAHGSVLQVELRDKAVALTRPRRSLVSVDAKDSDVLAKLLRNAGLQAQVEATSVQHPSLVQFDCTDWDWLVTRAEACGQVVAVTDGVVKVATPALSGPAALKVTWGTDVIDMDLSCDALGQDDGVDVSSWNAADLAVAAAQAVRPPAPAQGSLTGEKAAQALGFKKSTLVFPAGLQAGEAKAWASAEAARSQWGLLRGQLRVQGVGAIGLLDVVQIDGVAQAFAGQALVTGLCHRIAGGDWTTDLQCGLAAQPHHRRPDIASAPAAGLLPPASALQIAVVEAVAEDPDKQHRIKVRLPVLGDGAEGLWARLATPEAGKGRGISFRPEPGDEVVLGFFNDDPRQPVVLGALFGSKNTPPDAVHDATDKNTLRGLVTRSGLTLALDDDKKQLSLQMPSGAKLLMDDDGEAIVLSDKHGNKITLDKNGIALKSAKDLLLDASGNVTVKGAKIDLN
jgi:Rhs element Vgr protein